MTFFFRICLRFLMTLAFLPFGLDVARRFRKRDRVEISFEIAGPICPSMQSLGNPMMVFRLDWLNTPPGIDVRRDQSFSSMVYTFQMIGILQSESIQWNSRDN